MLCQGLQTLDKLDEVEDREQKEEEERQKAANNARQALKEARTAPNPIGFSGVAEENLLPLSPSFWDMLDFAGGTALEALGS